MSYVLAATLLLIAAVIIGAYLVVVGVRQQKRLPRLGLAHAVLAVLGTIALTLQIVEGPADKLNNVAAFFLVLALVGGAMVFGLHEKGRPPAMMMVAMHAMMGMVAVLLLVFSL